MNIYLVSGLGANRTAFDKLHFPEGYILHFIDWIYPKKYESLENYTKRMVAQIDPTQPFILIGLSFGGIIVQEMNRYVSPQKTLIISSIKQRSEMPVLYRLSSRIGLHRLLPLTFFTNNSFLSYAFFRKRFYQEAKHSIDFNRFFTYRNSHYLHWSINQIVRWHSPCEIKNLYHIHGTNDLIFPYRLLQKVDHTIDNGSHIMVMTRSTLVSLAIEAILND